MFQPICKTSTQIINEDGWVKKTEQGICPSFNRIKKWFQYNAEVNFNYAQVNIKGKIDNFFESNKTFHMKTLNNKSEEFEIMKIESFTATYFYKPIPTKIIYEKTRIKKIYSEEMNSPPPLNRIKFFYIKQLPITFTYTGHLNQTDIDEISGKIKTIDKLERKNSFYLDNGDVLFTSNICGYRTNYEVCEPYPLLESSKNEDISQIKVLLISGSQKFTVNWERLNKLIPNFKSLCSVNPLSKEMLEYDLSHLLDEQQLFLLLKYLNHEIELNQRNAFDLYYIAVLMEMDELKETTEFKATRYLIKKGTRSNIDLIQQQPILKTLLNKFGGKLLNYFQFNYPIISYHLYSPIEKYFNLKLRPWQNEYPEIECESIKDGLKDFTLFSHINELVFNFNHFESSHIKDILRICEIFGSKIEALCLREVEDSDTPLIISNLKEKKLKAIVFDSEIPYKNNNVKQAPNQNGLTKDGIAQLITLFQTLPELEEFRFENHQFDDEGVKLISDFIQNHPRLKTITLNTPFSEIAMEELCRSIKTTGIETLIIDGVRMKNYTNDGLLRWAELISENSTLKNLSLNNNQLNDSHLDLIIYIIKHNASLEIIDLLGNEDITSEGRKKLKNALQNNTTIKELMINNSYYNSVNLVKSKKAMDLTTDDA